MNFLKKISLLFLNVKIAGGLNLRKPKLAKKLIKGYVKSFFKKDGNLRFMDIALNYECNFHCDHCSAEPFKKMSEKMTQEQYKKFVSDAEKAGVITFHFTGGEPLMCQNLFEIIELFNPCEHIISIQTNGWFVDDKFLEDYKKIGGDILCVSIDSSNPQIHDEFRKQPGSWDKAINALKLAKKHGLQILMTSTITHQNIDSEDFKKIIAMAKKIGATLALNLPVPAGKWRKNKDFLFNSEDRIKLNNLLKKNPHMRTDFESNWHMRGCPAFKEKCYLMPNGEVLPCPFIQMSFGNVKESSLLDIQKKALQFDYFKKYHQICIAAEDNYFIENSGCYDIDQELLPLKNCDSALFKEKI